MDVRTKNFARFDTKSKREYIKIAHSTICELNGDQQNERSVASEAITPPAKKFKLQIFDFDKENISNTKKNLSAIELELNNYNELHPQNISPLEFWNLNRKNYPCLCNF